MMRDAEERACVGGTPRVTLSMETVFTIAYDIAALVAAEPDSRMTGEGSN